jgi:uncharacterized membrane protein (DUF2068 family)
MSFSIQASDDRMIRLIAVFKLVKAALLIAVGVGAFKLMHKDVGEVLEHGVRSLRLDPGNHLIDAAVGKAANLSPAQIKKLGLGSFLYAGLFSTEGTGLWMLKRWAEWLTIGITSSLVPIEIYEIHHHPTWIKWVVLGLNIAIVIYLIIRIRNRPASE